jgi:heat shock protein 1/8
MACIGCAIGFDLETANTRTAIFRNNAAEIVPHNGQSSRPSCVDFTKDWRLVRSAAISQAGVNPVNTIFDALKYAGRQFRESGTHETVSKSLLTMSQRDGRLVFVVRYRRQELVTTPIDILAMVIARAYKDTQTHLGRGYHITESVVTMPTTFNLCQRQTVWDAACVAGVEPLRFVNTAAMISAEFALNSPKAARRDVLCVDSGAGSLYVAVTVIAGREVELKAVGGNCYLGGQDFTSLLAVCLPGAFQQK